MSEQPLLYYFDGRGFGEIIRITLCLGGVEFNEKYLVTREEFLEKCDDHTFLFRCVPYFKWGDTELGQSSAIARYVARRTGLMGKDEEETARIDMMYEASRDLNGFYVRFGVGDKEAIKELKETVLPKFLPIFNKILEDTGTGYIEGASPTLADAGLLECLLATEDFIGEEVLQSHQEIKKFLQTMKKLPNIENYLKNIRKLPNSPELMSSVRKVLNWTEDNKPKKE